MKMLSGVNKMATAINPKYQKIVNRFIAANWKYDEMVDAGTEDSIAGDKAYNKASELISYLPKREQENLNVIGYL